MNTKLSILTLALPVLLMGAPAMAADDQGQSSIVGNVSESVAIADNDGGGRGPHGFHGGPGGPGGPGVCGNAHPLTDDQLEKMSALKDSMKEATAPEMMELHKLHHQQMDLMTRPTVDKAQVMALQAKINTLRSDLANKWLSYKLDKMALLDADQKQDMRHRYLMHNVFGHFGWHRGHGAGGGCGR